MNKLALYVVLGLIAVDFAGCSRESRSPAPQSSQATPSSEVGDTALAKALLGSWHENVSLPDGVQAEAVNTYMPNGLNGFAAKYNEKGRTSIVTAEGTWTVKDGQLFEKIKSVTIDGKALDEGDVKKHFPDSAPDKLLRITHDELVYIDDEGKTRVATRNSNTAAQFAQQAKGAKATPSIAAAPSASSEPSPAQQATENPGTYNQYFLCTPTKYREKYIMSDAKELNCRGKDAGSKACDPTRVDMSELHASGGYYKFVIPDEPNSDKPGQEFQISRADGSYSHRITLGEAATMTYSGTCEPRKERLKF